MYGFEGEPSREGEGRTRISESKRRRQTASRAIFGSSPPQALRTTHACALSADAVSCPRTACPQTEERQRRAPRRLCKVAAFAPRRRRANRCCHAVTERDKRSRTRQSVVPQPCGEGCSSLNTKRQLFQKKFLPRAATTRRRDNACAGERGAR